MLDAASPYLSYIVASYVLAVAVVAGMFLIQRYRCRRAKVRLERFKGGIGARGVAK